MFGLSSRDILIVTQNCTLIKFGSNSLPNSFPTQFSRNKGIDFKGNFPPVNFEIVRSGNSTRFVVVADVSKSMSNFVSNFNLLNHFKPI